MSRGSVWVRGKVEEGEIKGKGKRELNEGKGKKGRREEEKEMSSSVEVD